MTNKNETHTYNVEDTLMWTLKRIGTFRVKKAYKSLRNQHHQHPNTINKQYWTEKSSRIHHLMESSERHSLSYNLITHGQQKLMFRIRRNKQYISLRTDNIQSKS